MNDRIKYVAKAVVGTLAALLGALATGLIDGNLDLSEILSSASAALVAAGAIFRVPNGEL